MRKIICLIMLAICLTAFAGTALAKEFTVATFGAWSVIKTVDEMTDKIIYNIIYESTESPEYLLFGSIHGNGFVWFVCPGCVLDSGNISFRVDKNPAIKTKGLVMNYKAIGIKQYYGLIDQMKKGNTLYIAPNFYSISKKCNTIEKISLNGFTKAYKKFNELTK